MNKKVATLSFVIVALVALPALAQANESPGLGGGFLIRANNTQDHEIQSTAGLLTSVDNSNPGGTDPGETDPGTTDPEAPSGEGIGSFTYRCDANRAVYSPIDSSSSATVTWTGNGDQVETLAGDNFWAIAGVTYTVTVDGEASALNRNIEVSDNCLRSVNKWPEGLTTLNYAFNEQRNLTSVPDELPSTVTSLANTFSNTTSFNDDSLSSWDVSNVTDMNSTFRGSSFNQPIGSWDVSNVTTMKGMFFGNNAFNQSLAGWGDKTQSVTDMSEMFRSSSFNQDISGWDVSGVRTMGYMFYGSAFNRPIGDWDVSNVENMQGMFNNSSFDQEIADWDVNKVTNMNVMFNNSVFNQDLTTWANRLGNVKDMEGMFFNANFNRDISMWDVSGVTKYKFFASGSRLTTEYIPAKFVG